MKKKLELNMVDLQELFLNSCVNRGLSDGTVDWYKLFLTRYSQQYPILPMDPTVIETFIGNCNGRDERRHGCYRTLKAFYRFVFKRLQLQKRLKIANPIELVDPPKLTEKEKAIPTLDDIKKILEFPGHPKEIRAALYVIADTGARIGEIHNLDSGDVGQGTIRIRFKEGETKTGERIVPISLWTQKILESLGPGRLFSCGFDTFGRRVSRAFRDAGFPQYTAHSLRHAFASYWEGSDMSLKKIGGWRTQQMIDHYSHRKLEKAKKEHAIQSPLFKLYGIPDKPAAVPSPAGDPLGLAAYLSRGPVFVDQERMARYLFYLHALLANIGKNLLSMFEEYSRRQVLKKFCSGSIVEDALALNEIEIVGEEFSVPADTDFEKAVLSFYQEINVGSKSLWNALALLIKPFIADHESQALIFRGYSFEGETSLEDIQFNDLALVWKK